MITTVTTEYRINKIIANDFKSRDINPETDTYNPTAVTSRNLACVFFVLFRGGGGRLAAAWLLFVSVVAYYMVK